MLSLDGLLVSILRFVGGLVYFFILPGALLKILYFKKVPMLLSPILGLLLQVYNIFLLWVVYIVSGMQPLNIALLLILITLGEVVILILLISRKPSIKYYVKHYRNFMRFSLVDKYLLISIVIYLLLALYWQRFATEPNSDGAGYLDIARNIVEKGSFRSNMIFLPNDWRYVVFSTGFNYDIHSVGYFIFAVFFTFGDISLRTAQIALIFQGILIIFIIFELTKKVFNLNIARLSIILLSIHPEFITHVVLVGGPEISSILFLLLTYYMIILSVEDKENYLIYAVFGALSIFLTWFSWYYNFYIFFAQIPLMFLCISYKDRDFKFVGLVKLLIIQAYFILDYRLIGNLLYLSFGTSFPISLVILILILHNHRINRWSNGLKVFVTMILVLLSLFAFYRIVFQSTPQHVYFVRQNSKPSSFIQANIQKDLTIWLRSFLDPGHIYQYYEMYRERLQAYFGTVLVIFSILSVFKKRFIKEILMISSFPLFHFLFWIFFSIVDALQARYLLSAFIFYVVLAAIFIETFIASIRRKVLRLSVVVSIFLMLLFSFYVLYPNFEEILSYWNQRELYGWEPAINWINNNTPSDALLLTRSVNYFAWYTGRRVATLDIGMNLQPTDIITEPQLIALIKLYKANYLVIEKRTVWIFPYISSLLSYPSPFLGASIVFKDNNVVVYNVTNIAYGVPCSVSSYVLHEMESLNDWYPNLSYGNATLELDSESKINGNYSLKYTQLLASGKTQSCLFLKFSTPIDLSDFDYLSFYVKSSRNCTVTIGLITDPFNYFISPNYIIVRGNFTEVRFSVKVLKSMGRPQLNNITRIQICFACLTENRTFTNWIDGPLVLEKILYKYP